MGISAFLSTMLHRRYWETNAEDTNCITEVKIANKTSKLPNS